MPLAMAVGQKRRKTGTAGGRKRKAGKKPLLIDRGRLFLLSGVLAILCVLLLFINVLYGGEASAACGSGSIFAGEARPVPAAPAAFSRLFPDPTRCQIYPESQGGQAERQMYRNAKQCSLLIQDLPAGQGRCRADGGDRKDFSQIKKQKRGDPVFFPARMRRQVTE